MKKKRSMKRPFNEVFKNKFKAFFEKFAIVKTEFELLGLPRRLDMLVVEADTPIKEHVSLFQYFKKFNIIEFKSEVDELTLEGYLKMGYYLHAFLLREPDSSPENTTLTLISTFKPKIPVEKISWKQIRKGLYLVKGIGIVDLHVVVIDELSYKDKEERDLLKIFVSQKSRRQVILDIFTNGTDEEKEDAFLLYREEVKLIIREIGVDMNALKREAYKIAKEYGIDKEIKEEYQKLIEIEKYKAEKAESEKQKAESDRQKAEQKIEIEKKKTEAEKKRAERKVHKEKLRTAITMKKKGFTIDQITSITELETKFLEKLFLKFDR